MNRRPSVHRLLVHRCHWDLAELLVGVWLREHHGHLGLLVFLQDVSSLLVVRFHRHQCGPLLHQARRAHHLNLALNTPDPEGLVHPVLKGPNSAQRHPVRLCSQCLLDDLHRHQSRRRRRLHNHHLGLCHLVHEDLLVHRALRTTKCASGRPVPLLDRLIVNLLLHRRGHRGRSSHLVPKPQDRDRIQEDAHLHPVFACRLRARTLLVCLCPLHPLGRRHPPGPSFRLEHQGRHGRHDHPMSTEQDLLLNQIFQDDQGVRCRPVLSCDHHLALLQSLKGFHTPRPREENCLC